MGSLADAIKAVPGQPASVRIGRVDAVGPLAVSAQGVPFDDVGVLTSAVLRVGDAVVLLGQSSEAGSDPASWLALGVPSPNLAVPAASDSSSTDIVAFVNTAYAVGTPVVGLVFTAPQSGRVRVDWTCRMQQNTAGDRVLAAVSVNEGAVLGAGVVFLVPGDDNSLETVSPPVGGADSRFNAGTWRLVAALVPGTVYNVTVQHRTTGGNGSIFYRSIMVSSL